MYLCTFQHPWTATNTDGRAALQHDTIEAIPILKMCPKLNPILAQAIMSCIDSDPNKRPESAEAFLKMISKVDRVYEDPSGMPKSDNTPPPGGKTAGVTKPIPASGANPAAKPLPKKA